MSDKPLSEAMVVCFTDVYMRHSAPLSKRFIATIISLLRNHPIPAGYNVPTALDEEVLVVLSEQCLVDVEENIYSQ